MNMNEWLKNAPQGKKALPVLSFPGVQLTQKSVSDMVHSARNQADCMKAIAERYDMLASVSLMDLSVEAEAFGSPVRYDDHEVPTVTGAIANNLEEINALKVPKVGDGRTGECVKAIAYAKQEITDRPVIAGMIGPFSLAGRLMDMTEIMIKCFTDPEEVTLVLEKATDFLLEYAKALKAAGADGVVIAEPAAGLLTPEFIGEFSSPYVKRIIQALEDENFLVIYHNCGNTIPLINEVLQTGAKCFSFGNAIDMSEMMKLIPENLVAIGNVDPSSIFRNGSVEDVKTATKTILEKCSKYPNYIISSGCDIPPMTPLENIDAFFATVREFYN